MKDEIQNLIGSLREELQQYGEMLALLDRQHQFIMVRDAAEVFQSAGSVQGQAAVIKEARAEREKRRARLAETLRQSESADFATIIPLLPPDYRPLVRALVDENNELLVRVRQRARQNHLLLSRSLELMQGLLNALMPSRETRVYNDHGNMHTHTIVTHSFYDAVG